jgi:hypothetical protein
MTRQLTLFGKHTDGQPLPLLIADSEGFALQHHQIDGVLWYAVQDWITGVAHTDNASTFWKKLQKRTVPMTGMVEKMAYKARNGKTYQMDFATDETLYLITQRMDANTGIRNKILDYLARSGVILDEIRRDPGAAQKFIDEVSDFHQLARSKGKEKRVGLTQVARETHVIGKPNYAALTNAEYEELFGAAKAALVEMYGLTPAQAANFRDQLGTLAISALDVAETSSMIEMQKRGRRLTTDEQIAIVRESARIIAPAFRQLADRHGIDLVTGQPLLAGA